MLKGKKNIILLLLIEKKDWRGALQIYSLSWGTPDASSNLRQNPTDVLVPKLFVCLLLFNLLFLFEGHLNEKKKSDLHHVCLPSPRMVCADAWPLTWSEGLVRFLGAAWKYVLTSDLCDARRSFPPRYPGPRCCSDGGEGAPAGTVRPVGGFHRDCLQMFFLSGGPLLV